MRVVSVNVGKPRTAPWRGKTVSTGIFKAPVAGRIPIRRLNLDGDRQADLTVHGGPDKAVYAYPAEHYPFWREIYPDRELSWAQFGENLTTEGLREDTVQLGDRFRVGTALLVVAQPRMPCFKLGIRFNDPKVLKRFRESERSGIYFSVAEEGAVEAGDAITLVEQATHGVTVRDIARLLGGNVRGRDDLERALAVPTLPVVLRDYFTQRLAEPTA